MPNPVPLDKPATTLIFSSWAVPMVGCFSFSSLQRVLLWSAFLAAVAVLHRAIWSKYGTRWQGKRREYLKDISYLYPVMSVIGIGVLMALLEFGIRVFGWGGPQMKGHLTGGSQLTGSALRMALAGFVLIGGFLAFKLKQFSQYYYGMTEILAAVLALATILPTVDTKVDESTRNALMR